MIRHRLCAAVMAILALWFTAATFEPPLALADPDVHPWEDDVEVTVTITHPGKSAGIPYRPRNGPPWEYIWLLECPANVPGKPMTDCDQARTCPDKDDFSWVLWGRPVAGGADARGWRLSSIACWDGRPPPAPKPRLTPDRVLEAVRRMGLPSLQVQVQPETATLVNFDTIFYAEPETFERTVNLLGYSVDVRAEGSTYRWWFGDGGAMTTQQPGAPYPAKDITHQYADAHVNVHPRVDVTYEVQYRVDGGAWQTLGETLTAEGPETTLRIKEATPVLSGGD